MNRNAFHSRSKSHNNNNKFSTVPAKDLVHRVKTILRFYASASGTQNVSVPSILGAIGGVCVVANSSIQPWCSSFRIKQVDLYPSASSSGEDAANVQWDTGLSAFIKDSLKDITMPIGITIASKVSSNPPPKTLASDWIASTATGNVFSLNVASGTIIDIHIDYTLSATFEANAISIATGTLGKVYYLALDGPSTNVFVPVALVTTH